MTDQDNSTSRQVAKMLDPETWGENVQSVMEKYMQAASVTTAYGAPVIHGDTLILPTAEVVSVLGYGVGVGGGLGTADSSEKEPNIGGGGGGGGGGQILSRPVAVVIATPQGVRVEPVVDVTKLGIAALTAVGFMAATYFRMRNMRRAIRDFRAQAREVQSK